MRATTQFKGVEIVDLVRQAGPAGMLTAEVAAGLEVTDTRALKCVTMAMCFAVKREALAARPAPGPSAPWRRRYFAPEFAPAVDAAPPAKAKAPPPVKNIRAQAPNGPAVLPAGFTVTVLPSAPVYSRHQLPPGTRVRGGFADMGMGRYLDDRGAA